MTETEAIRELQHNIDSPRGDYVSKEVSAMAISALERQIPKKPRRIKAVDEDIECTTNWQYEINENQNDVWKLVEQDKITTIYLSKNADKYDLKTTKTNKTTGRETRVVNMCKNNITEKEANKLISGFTQ